MPHHQNYWPLDMYHLMDGNICQDLLSNAFVTRSQALYKYEHETSNELLFNKTLKYSYTDY